MMVSVLMAALLMMGAQDEDAPIRATPNLEAGADFRPEEEGPSEEEGATEDDEAVDAEPARLYLWGP